MDGPNPNRTTPGIYSQELDAFPPSIAGVQTAVPAFIGYTEKASLDGKSVFLTPIPVSSMAEFESTFGVGFKQVYNIVEVTAISSSSGAPVNWDFQVGDSYYRLQRMNALFNLYWSMRLFFANGGGSCYVVSVGDYTHSGQSPSGVAVDEADLIKGLGAIREQAGPTMLVIPDAVLLPDLGSFAMIAQAMLTQSGALQDRMALLDVYGAEAVNQKNVSTALDPVITAFQSSVGGNSLSYGSAYFPFLNTTVAQSGDVNYTNFNPLPDPSVTTSPAGGTMLQYLLEEVADSLYAPGSAARQTVQNEINQITVVVEDPRNPGDPAIEAKIQALNQSLTNALPPYQQWQDIMLEKRNILPPSAGMAGVFTLSDETQGVWNAPANVALNSVASCTVNLNDAQQGPLNTPLNGKAIDVIRDFAGRGPIVWGARTLDGNNYDYRYIQVRRTIIYIQQSIQNALNPFVFAANDGQTWVTVTSMISNFLQGVWSQGGLMGDKASDAYSVACGLGSTMTAQDILDGYMIVQVTLQMIRPAEFIELTFKQKMQGA